MVAACKISFASFELEVRHKRPKYIDDEEAAFKVPSMHSFTGLASSKEPNDRITVAALNQMVSSYFQRKESCICC